VGASTELDGEGLILRVCGVSQKLFHTPSHRDHTHRVGVHFTKYRPEFICVYIYVCECARVSVDVHGSVFVCICVCVSACTQVHVSMCD